MGATPTGSILINLVDGTRQPLSSGMKWNATIHDGRAPSQWKKIDVPGSGSAELIKGLTYFDNFFDQYTVIVRAKKYHDAAWMPVNISFTRPAAVHLMLLPKGGHVNFSGAGWQTLSSLRPRFAEILSMGTADPATRYGDLMDEPEGLKLACLLNLLTAMSQIKLPSKKTPLDYYWQPIWDDPTHFPMQQDRFFAYVDQALIQDVKDAAALKAFSRELDPGSQHPGATLSYKQNQFDVANLQLTFHEGNTLAVPGPGGTAINCVVIEPDIDYFKDPLAHFFGEVLPHWVTKGKTDPRAAGVLRWMASQQAGSDFNPLYTITS